MPTTSQGVGNLVQRFCGTLRISFSFMCKDQKDSMKLEPKRSKATTMNDMDKPLGVAKKLKVRGYFWPTFKGFVF